MDVGFPGEESASQRNEVTSPGSPALKGEGQGSSLAWLPPGLWLCWGQTLQGDHHCCCSHLLTLTLHSRMACNGWHGCLGMTGGEGSRGRPGGGAGLSPPLPPSQNEHCVVTYRPLSPHQATKASDPDVVKSSLESALITQMPGSFQTQAVSFLQNLF